MTENNGGGFLMLVTQQAIAEPSGAAIVLDSMRLNIEARSRTSRLPWRGQFSPELIEYLMEAVCPDSRSFLDPFCGSGTVLYEAVLRNRRAWGQEVNPAAWHLASLARLACLPPGEKSAIVRRVRALVAESSSRRGDLFSSGYEVQDLLRGISTETDWIARCVLAAVVLLGMGDQRELTPNAIARGGFAVLNVLSELVDHSAEAECHLADARCIRLPSDSIEAVITSPPYINVFNYHQNYRPAVELLGWKPLEAARSEIGANRKHRMNRFLTVVQYCLDISQCLAEIVRVMAIGAPLVMVLGRTSNVLGASFQNGDLIGQLLHLSGAFGQMTQAQRVFRNRFGAEIYEDILIAHKQGAATCELDAARAVAVAALEAARGMVPERNLPALTDAIEVAAGVKPSPVLKLTTPVAFAAAV